MVGLLVMAEFHKGKFKMGQVHSTGPSLFVGPVGFLLCPELSLISKDEA
jgi:hypothetical protein